MSDHDEAEKVRPVALACTVLLAVVGALLPEIGVRYLDRWRQFADLPMIIGPGIFMVATAYAYHFSAGSKATLLLLLLAPLCFFRWLQFLFVGLLWSLRGGMV